MLRPKLLGREEVKISNFEERRVSLGCSTSRRLSAAQGRSRHCESSCVEAWREPVKAACLFKDVRVNYN